MTKVQFNITGIWPRLLAFCVKSDSKTSAEEIAAVQQFLNRRFDMDEAASLMAAFQKELGRETLVHDLERAFDELALEYEDRVDVLVQIYDLFMADGLEKSEVELFWFLAQKLGIRDEDVDLICSIGFDRYAYTHSGNVDRKLLFSGDPEVCDLYAPDSEVEVFRLPSAYYLFNKGSQVPVFVNSEEVDVSQVFHIEQDAVIRVGKCKFVAEDIELYFRQRSQFARILSFEVAGDRLVPAPADQCDMRLHIHRNLIRLYRVSSNFECTVNGEAISDFTFLNLQDRVIVNGGYLLPATHLVAMERPTPTRMASPEDDEVSVWIGTQRDEADFIVNASRTVKVQLVYHHLPSRHFKYEPSTDFEATWRGQVLDSGTSKELTEEGLLEIEGTRFWVDPSSMSVELLPVSFESFSARDLHYKFPAGKTAIDELSFSTRKGDFVAVMGASGAGKSTLFQLLLGYVEPTSGELLLNGQDFHAILPQIRERIGYVPQDDLLKENLTVFQNLYFAARLRMKGASKSQINQRVEEVLDVIGLSDKRDLRVGSVVKKVLSGGQRKRLNVGLELVSDPLLFLLDEPTSGLSSKDSEQMLLTLRRLARRGKIIFVVIHQPSAVLYNKFDKLLLLDVGGKLAYFGDNQGAIDYFEAFLPVHDRFDGPRELRSPDVIFDVLEAPRTGPDGLPLATKSEVRRSGLPGLFGRTHVINGVQRKRDPEFWKTLFLAKHGNQDKSEDEGATDEIALPRDEGGSSLFSRLSTLVRREFTDKLNNPSNLVLTLVLPVMLGLALGGLFRGDDIPYAFSINPEAPKFFFLSSIVFIFFGLMSSVGEVVRDRPQLIRERLVNVRPYQYLLSKVLVFVLFSTIQAGLYVFTTFSVLEIPSGSGAVLLGMPMMSFHFYAVIVLLATAFSVYCIGLLISSFLRSEIVAFNIIPLFIIPQILLGGLLLDFDSMPKPFNDNVPWYGDLMVSRWSYEALSAGGLSFNEVFVTINADRATRYLANRGLNSEQIEETRIRFRNTLMELQNRLRTPVATTYEASLFEEYVLNELQYYVSNPTSVRETYFAQEGAYYTTRPDADLDAILSLFRQVGFLTEYFFRMANETIEAQFNEARTSGWNELLQSPEEAGLLGQSNLFPATDKIFIRQLFSTVFFNIIILISGGLIALIGSIVVLRKSKQ